LERSLEELEGEEAPEELEGLELSLVELEGVERSLEELEG
jgi:hypothetical protein